MTVERDDAPALDESRIPAPPELPPSGRFRRRPGARRRRPKRSLREATWGELQKRVRRTGRRLARLPRKAPTLTFVLGLLLLDATVNLRYPGDEPPLWYLLPSLDIVALLALLAVLGRLGVRLPTPARVALVAVLVFVRFLRLGDGVQERYFYQHFNLYSDLPLVPELVRFAHSTLPLWQFALVVLGSLLGLGLFVLALYGALAHAERYLEKRRHVSITVGILGFLYVLSSVVGHPPQHDPLFYGAFGQSAYPRVAYEAKFLMNVYGENARHAQAIARVQDRLARTKQNLAKLEGADVHLILVESYGQAVFERRKLMEAARKTYADFEEALRGLGFSIFSGVLDSSTYGGQSWLAHATLNTGIRTRNQLEYEIVCAKKPLAIATFFRNAGYRTVLAQPGTTREWPKGEFYNFEQKYYSWQYEYAGPPFAWATMPDQYVLDYIRRKELAPAARERDPRPRFIEYVLVSSHAPWSALPPIVEDWSKLGDGSIFHDLEATHFPIEWPHFENASEAYIRSILYDFKILRRFIADTIPSNALVVILGDHQPVREVNGYTDSRHVPVHVLSKNAKLLEPFQSLGYTAGMIPRSRGPAPGLETLLFDLLSSFSTE